LTSTTDTSPTEIYTLSLHDALPISDQDSLPPYPVLDDILECLVELEMSTEDIVGRGHDEATVHRIEHLLYIAEYKRRQSAPGVRSEEHTSELQSRENLVCRLLLEKK